MEILGLGTQVMECARVRQLLDEHADAFLKQVYTDREVRFCNTKRQTTEQYTALWAAKEAVFRALGTTWKRGTNWTDVEVFCDTGTPPHAVVSGATRELMTARGVNHVLLTMAFCRTFATATAIASRAAGPLVPEDTALDD
ncbi:holo-ACP synthase [Gemmata sp. G18]|uniref:Holo-[acyl-carrier-protein] synthase n=1 Tax=Gemmata palustris TaxID=2822762 RepID=A0ABS5C4A6_9BACT|nr:holo-ACP synthase [Gemmata palustris]MBP3960305.1 holo-ACP synthase [Gemmata palustris]